MEEEKQLEKLEKYANDYRELARARPTRQRRSLDDNERLRCIILGYISCSSRGDISPPWAVVPPQSLFSRSQRRRRTR